MELDLKLEDLDLGLSPNEEKKLKERQAQLSHSKLPPEPIWHDEAQVLIINSIECKCGAQFESPGALRVLVRRRNNRGLIHESECDHPPNNLKKETRIRKSFVHVCANCF